MNLYWFTCTICFRRRSTCPQRGTIEFSLSLRTARAFSSTSSASACFTHQTHLVNTKKRSLRACGMRTHICFVSASCVRGPLVTMCPWHHKQAPRQFDSTYGCWRLPVPAICEASAARHQEALQGCSLACHQSGSQSGVRHELSRVLFDLCP